AFTVGKYLDRPGSKKPKALQSIFVIAVLIMLMWGSAMWVQVEFDLGNGKKDKNIDFQEGAFWLKFLLYMFYGFNDSIVQVWAYWLMGQFSDDMSTLGRYAGYYKCVQSGMAAVGWRLGGIPISPVSNIIVNWTLSTVGLVLAFISVKTYMEEKTQDEGLESPSKDKPLIAH
ncbi:hypothetical protein DYB31_014212, partial [Aphanomyces astaci]